ncbi:hypothetical protein E2C01_008361 [Portunus trituberculatus]|uniref:Uncharacterized protein n=1 Tax=Portunus trituberculatus TaxID=210409 RepID=A0A5B7D2M1_PORTR|nr:hypothetical protein [Portunus trituberculatus]
MCLGGDMDPNMGSTVNKIACTTVGRELNSASYIYSSREQGPNVEKPGVDHIIGNEDEEAETWK